MNKILLYFTLTLLLIIPVFSQAEMEFENEQLSVGVLDEGKKVDLLFNFENTGDQTLIIKKINTACGCVLSKLSKREYEPGEKGTIKINYNSKSRYGRVNQQIAVYTNTQKKYYRLTIVGTVVRNNYGSASVPMEMRRIDFGVVKAGEEYSSEVVMTNKGNRSFKIIKTTHSPEIITEFEKVKLLPNETCKISIRYRPKQLGEFGSLLLLETSALKGKHITVMIKAKVRTKVREIEKTAEQENQ
jgi:hypothetical protein